MMKPVPAPRRGPSRSRSGGRPNRSGASGSWNSGLRLLCTVPRELASMFTTAGLRRSAISANDPTIGPVAAVGAGRTVARVVALLLGADWAGAGVIDPATIRPTKNDTVATRHTVTARNRLGIYANHYKGLRAQGSGLSEGREGKSTPATGLRRASGRLAAWLSRPCCR